MFKPAPVKHILAVFLLSITAALAQPVTSPEVHPDGTVTFRLSAPKAQDVQLICEGVPNSPNENATVMLKGSDGTWRFTTEPLNPDIYGYSFVIDGVVTVDPNNPFLKYNLLHSKSQVEVPGPALTPWQVADVPHGDLHRHLYKSAAGGDERNFTVYTPPGYNPSGHKRYPVLYLLHGYSDNDTVWTQTGRANIILDNLIARGQAQPMIVVMPLGYGDMNVLKLTGKLDQSPLWQANLDKFTLTLLDEVMPQVQTEYRVATGPKFTAIAGLSMGGAESLIAGLNHLDRFGWIGAFSAGGLNDYPTRFPALDAGANKKLHLLWIGCGHEDGLYNVNRQLCAWLAGKGVRYAWTEIPGVHNYHVWRPFFAQFAPLLFQSRR